ncbi:ribosome-binding protein 1 isoform X2 [Ambystoma mexicanum]|uniref:ribosome-binding protein 1 isoform X2 n=1 Tax=Ambystoma mexicanum TaxID=8296 RepID=UPI0037E845C3
MDLYDPQTLGVMVFGGFMVISAIGIFLVSTFSMKETSYEEALAKQRKVLEKSQHPKVDKKKKEKLLEKKGRAKKREDKPNGKIPEQDSAQEMNDSSKELDSEPEIIAEFIMPEPPAVTISAPSPPSPAIHEKPAPSPKDKKKKEKKVTKVEPAPMPVLAATQSFISKSLPVSEVPIKEAPVVAAVPVIAQSSAPVAVSAPPKKIDAIPQPIKKVEVVAQATKKVEVFQSQEEPKQEAAVKKKAVPKKKAEPIHADSDGPIYLPYNTLLSTVGSMSFTEGEAQRLIEILTEKAGVVQDTWHTASQKGDLVSTLKRQLEEKEKLLSAEQEDTAAAKNKLRELSKELASEKLKAVGVETNLKEQLLSRDQEINAVQARMQATYQDHIDETQQLQGKIRSLQEQLENGPNAQLTRLQQENSILRDALNQATSQMESKQNAELAKLRQECAKLTKELIEKSETLQQEEQQRKSLDIKVVAFEKQVGQLQVSQRETEDTLQKRIEEMTEELRRSQSSYNILQAETEKSKGEQESLADLQIKLLCSEEENKHKTEELGHFKDQLQAVTTEKERLTERIKTIETLLEASANSEAEHNKELQAAKEAEIIHLQNRLQEKDAEISSLEKKALELQSTLEQQTIHNHAAQHEEIVQLQTRIQEKEAQISSMEKEALELKSTVEHQTVQNNATEHANVVQLQERLQQKEDFISLLEKQVLELKEAAEQQQLTKNATEDAEVRLQTRLQEKEHLILSLEKEAATLKETMEQQRITNHAAEQAEINQLQTRLQEREDFISSLERETAELKGTVEQQRSKNNEETEQKLGALQTQTKEALQSLFPHVTLVSDQVYSEWLQEFKEKAQEILSQQTAKTEYPDLSSQLREAEEAHSTLQAECDQYRTILAETEGMLRHLQRSVEQEELVWKAKLSKTEGELKEAHVQIRNFEESVEKLKLEVQNSDQLRECISLMEQQLEAQMNSENAVSQNYSKEVESLQQLLQETQEQLQLTKNEARKQSNELSLVRKHLSEMKIHVHDGEVVGSQADQTEQEPNQLKSQLEETEATLNDEQTLRQKLADEFDEAAESALSVRTELAKLRFEQEFTSDAEETNQLKERLEKEKKLTQDLGHAATKLQQLLKATQDQLAKERENVKKLQGLLQETVC